VRLKLKFLRSRFLSVLASELINMMQISLHSLPDLWAEFFNRPSEIQSESKLLSGFPLIGHGNPDNNSESRPMVKIFFLLLVDNVCFRTASRSSQNLHYGRINASVVPKLITF
jgi:hypothetical protein